MTKSEERNDFCKKKRSQDEDGDVYDLAVLNRIKRAASDEKELVGNPYSSMALAKEAAEAVRPWPYQY